MLCFRPRMVEWDAGRELDLRDDHGPLATGFKS